MEHLQRQAQTAESTPRLGFKRCASNFSRPARSASARGAPHAARHRRHELGDREDTEVQQQDIKPFLHEEGGDSALDGGPVAT